jgi:hypothetical protein
MENLNQWLSCKFGTWFNNEKYDERTNDYFYQHVAFGRYIFSTESETELPNTVVSGAGLCATRRH